MRKYGKKATGVANAILSELKKLAKFEGRTEKAQKNTISEISKKIRAGEIGEDANKVGYYANSAIQAANFIGCYFHVPIEEILEIISKQLDNEAEKYGVG